MPEIFNGEEVDFSQAYRDTAIPKDQDPSEALYGLISGALKAQPVTTTPKPGGVTVPGRATGRGVSFDRGSGGPRVTPGTGSQRPPGAGGLPTGASADTMAVLARLKPLGINNLGTLRGKSDIELRKLSGQVVTYELRQQSLAKFFKQKPDGSWDFTTGPDGQPTGLDANGKPVKPAGAGTTTKPPAGGATTPPTKPAPATKPPTVTGKVAVTRPRPASTAPVVTAPRTTSRVVRPGS